MSSTEMLVSPPRRVPWLLRPALFMARRMTGKEPMPARMLAWWPKGAFGAGVFELTAAGASDLDPRCLAIARLVASRTAGCPFCVDMNAAAAADYARALSATPVVLPEALRTRLREAFTPRELVVLASTIAQVNFWSRFNQGLDIPAAGFFTRGG